MSADESGQAAEGHEGPAMMPPPPAAAAGAGWSGSGGGAGVSAPRNGFGVAALVLGILALVGCWTTIGGIVLGVLAVIFGALGVRRANQRVATNKGMSIAGIITGAIGLVLGIVFAIFIGTVFSMFSGQIHNLQQCVQQANGDQAKIQQCEQQYQQQIKTKVNGG